MKRPRLLLADDHRLFVEGLRRLLEPEFELVDTVEDGRALVAAADKLKPDVIIADISMPLLNGIEAGRQIKKSDPNMKIIFLTMHEDVGYASEAFQAGAAGYLVKRSTPDELVTAIHVVLKGRVYLSPMIAKDVMYYYMEGPPEPKKQFSILTARERKVLELVAEGRTHKKVATVLSISIKTAQAHRYSIMEKLGLRTTAELTRYAIKHGMVSV